MGDFQYDRLDNLLKKNRTTRKYLCLSAGHADNYIRGFEKRGKEPPREFVKYCADKLGTTTAYLYGETDDPSPVPAPAALEQKEKWYADECAASETNELPFREVEQHLGFYFG